MFSHCGNNEGCVNRHNYALLPKEDSPDPKRKEVVVTKIPRGTLFWALIELHLRGGGSARDTMERLRTNFPDFVRSDMSHISRGLRRLEEEWEYARSFRQRGMRRRIFGLSPQGVVCAERAWTTILRQKVAESSSPLCESESSAHEDSPRQAPIFPGPLCFR